MEEWQIRIVTGAASALISFVAGYGTFWLKNREKEKAGERRERKRQAEYEEFLKRRRVTGAKVVERTEVLNTHAHVLADMHERGISQKALFDLMEFSLTGKRPNNNEESVVRSDDEIRKAIDELHDKLWWDRHKLVEQKVELGYEKLDPDTWEKQEEEAERIKKKHGIENLGWDEFGAGMIEGKLAALVWLSGESWDFFGEPESAGVVRQSFKEFADNIEEMIDDWLKRPRAIDEANNCQADPIRHLLQSTAFSLLAMIDNGQDGRFVEDLHEIYARFAWRGGKAM